MALSSVVRATLVGVLVVWVALLASVAQATASGETNVWGVIVSSSRYLFNYRHTANALTMYYLMRQHGVDDDHLLLFMPDSFACDPRNPFPSEIKSFTLRGDEEPNLYGCSAQVDYSGDDVDVERFLQVLQGRYDENTPPTRRLESDENTNLVIYLAGHAAKSFFKFQDSEFLSSTDLSETFTMMYTQRRYKRILFFADTCHALALCEHIRAPNIVCLAASNAEEESYSIGGDEALGVSLSSIWMAEVMALLDKTNCSASPAEEPVLHGSLYNLLYGPQRSALPIQTFANPVYQNAVNDPTSVRTWRVSDFLCHPKGQVRAVPLREDLL